MILITTPGKVGASAARTLAAQGHLVRLIARRPEQHAALAAAGVEVIAGDLDQPETIKEAVSDVRSIILVTPPVPEYEIAVIDAASAAGVGHITKITSSSAPDSPIVRRRDQYRIEQALQRSGLPHTLLRSNAYMQNLLALAPTIAATSAFASNAADGRVGMIDARDVGAAAAAIAADPNNHDGKTYWLSGPEPLSYDDVAAILSKILGRQVTHHPITTEEQTQAMIALGLPLHVARANAHALQLFAEGDSDWITEDLRELIGRPATALSEFAGEHATRFSNQGYSRDRGAVPPAGAAEQRQ